MPELHIYDVLRRPVVTEKSNRQAEAGQYVFEVARSANKIQIREAIEVLFEVKVAKVNTMVMPAKRGRRGRNWYVRSREWKKAIVTLAEGKIELFNV
ncbi:MAG: 50S ribosomal protein L23 [Chloroflexi bacterium]|nr:50S ribosomal protein L23 [Chloroflexota bacterium]